MNLILNICDELEKEQKNDLNIQKVKEKLNNKIKENEYNLLQMKSELNICIRFDDDMNIFYTKIIALASLIISMLLGLYQVVHKEIVSELIGYGIILITIVIICTIACILLVEFVVTCKNKIGNRTKWLRVIEVVLNEIDSELKNSENFQSRIVVKKEIFKMKKCKK